MILGTDKVKKLIDEDKLVENLCERELNNPESIVIDLRLNKLFKLTGKGFLGIDEELKDTVDTNMILSICYDKYTTYIFNVKYNKDLPMYFSNVNKFAEKYFADKITAPHSGLFEKIAIDWFPISYFKNPKAKEIIRPHYREIINSIIKNESFIINEIKKLPNKQ